MYRVASEERDELRFRPGRESSRISGKSGGGGGGGGWTRTAFEAIEKKKAGGICRNKISHSLSVKKKCSIIHSGEGKSRVWCGEKRREQEKGSGKPSARHCLPARGRGCGGEEKTTPCVVSAGKKGGKEMGKVVGENISSQQQQKGGRVLHHQEGKSISKTKDGPM